MNRKTARNGSGPWSDVTQPSGRGKASLGPAEIMALVGLLLLIAFGAGALYLNRYEIGSAGGVPARLDRLTGQVIGCVPTQGCFEFIPAGEPHMRTLQQRPNPAAAGNAAAPAAAAPEASPAAGLHHEAPTGNQAP